MRRTADPGETCTEVKTNEINKLKSKFCCIILTKRHIRIVKKKRNNWIFFFATIPTHQRQEIGLGVPKLQAVPQRKRRQELVVHLYQLEQARLSGKAATVLKLAKCSDKEPPTKGAVEYEGRWN